MAAINETGHGINISNFKKQIDMCSGYGAVYNPTNNDIKVTNMTQKWTDARDIHNDLLNTVQQSKIPLNEREALFAPLSKLVTKVNSYVKSIGAGNAYEKDVKGLADKIRGIKVKVKKLEDGNPDPNDVSKSHLSYVMRTENFRSLIDLLNSQTLYNPNEIDIKVVTLTALLTDMETKNNAIGNILSTVGQARIARDQILYNSIDGIILRAKISKQYVKAIYGANSAEYKLISGIKYRNQKFN